MYKISISYPVVLSILLILAGCAKQPLPTKPSEKSRKDKWIDDLNYFEAEFLNTAKTYTEASKDSCIVILGKLKEQINELSDLQIKLALSKCVTLADNGHTTLPLRFGKKLPLSFYHFSDGLYIVKTDNMHSKYLGAKVIEINGEKVDKVEARLFPYLSGIERWKRYKTAYFLTIPALLHEVGFAQKDALTLTLTKEEDNFEVTLKAQKVEGDKAWYEGWANLFPTSNQENNWKFLLKDKNSLPLYLRKIEEGVFYSFDSSNKIAYFHINGLWENCPNFKERVEQFIEALKSRRDYNVVIDLRFYTGGNYAYAVKLANKPPKIINEDRKIYLITSDKTYSAAIVTAARIKHYAKDKIEIVGEEVGDRLKFWAESEVCTLPNSGIRIYNPRKEHDWQDNKRGFSRTHFSNFLYGVGVKDLKVDKEIGFNFEDYNNNVDPIMEWIIRKVSQDY